MVIAHKLDDFIFELFPATKDLKNNQKELENYFAEYYSYNNIKPNVRIDDGIVFIEIDLPTV